MRTDLTGADYDALFAAMKDDMPRLMRELFPKILAQREGTGVLTVSATDTEILVRCSQPPATVVYRVERKRSLH